MTDKDNNQISYAQLVELLKASQQQVSSQNQMLETLNQVIQDLRQQVAKFQAMLFGTSSERKSNFSKKPNKTETELKKQKQTNTKSKPKGRKPLPPEFPRKVVEYDLAEDKKNCETCHAKLRSMGFEQCEQLEYVPAQFFVMVHKRHKYQR